MNSDNFWYDALKNIIYGKQQGVPQPENTVEITYEQYLAIVNPPPTNEEIVANNEIKAKVLVKRTLNSNITVNNVEFSVNAEFYNFLNNYVNSRNSDDGDQTVDWFDVNYLHVQVTLQNLRTILRTYQERILNTLKKYNEWLATDKMTEFTVE